MVNTADIRELIDNAEELCSSIRDNPSGCEGCWLFDWDDPENFKCPLKANIEKIEKQLREENKK